MVGVMLDKPAQRDAQQFRVRPVTLTEGIYSTKHQTFLRAQITRNLLKQKVGGGHCHEQTTPIGKIRTFEN